MKVGELVILNKNRYTKVYLLENDKDNKPKFKLISEENLDEKLIDLEAKDYFLLEKEGFDEIFGISDNLGIVKEDKVLLIGV